MCVYAAQLLCAYIWLHYMFICAVEKYGRNVALKYGIRVRQMHSRHSPPNAMSGGRGC